MKPSLDVNSMKEFCIQHVEKFVFGGVVLLLLLFAVQAVARIGNSGPGFSPDELSSLAKAARDHWVGTEPGVYLTSKDLKIVSYSKEAEGILDPIPDGPFIHEVPWNRPMFEQRRKRELPKRMAIEEVRAAAVGRTTFTECDEARFVADDYRLIHDGSLPPLGIQCWISGYATLGNEIVNDPEPRRAVIEADAGCDEHSEGRWRKAAHAVYVAQIALEHEIHGDRDQHDRQEDLQDISGKHRCE